MSEPTRKPRGPRRINGSEILDVAGASAFFGWSDRATYSKVARHAIPYRKLSGRIVFLRSELVEFCRSLPGVTLEEVRQGELTMKGAQYG